MKFANKKSKAQSLVEYALILALVTVIAITALQFLGQKVNNAVTGVADDIESNTNNAAQTYCESIGGTYSDGKCSVDSSGN